MTKATSTRRAMRTGRARALAIAMVLLYGGSAWAAAGSAGAPASAPSARSAKAAPPAAHAQAASAPLAHGLPQKLKDKKPTAPKGPLVDINSASRAQLKALPGITDEEADRIIAGRPYKTKTDLVDAKAIPAGRYLSIKRLIIAKPPKKTSGKA